MASFGLLDPQISVGSSLTIEELGPSGPGLSPRSVVLTGPSLPFMGAEWAFENNLITTWYPGNGAEATQQLLGPREMPSTWEGEWKRTLMGKHPTPATDSNGAAVKIAHPHLLRELLESMARSGVRLRVTWAASGTESVGNQTSGVVQSRNPDGTIRRDRMIQTNVRDVDVKIVREGRVKTFRTPIDRATDIRWSIEFHWVSRGLQQDKTANVREDDSADQAALALEASIAATLAATQAKIFNSNTLIRKSSTHLTLGQLENLASAPQKLVDSLSRQLQQNVNDFKRVGEIAKKFSVQPTVVTGAVVDFARNTTAAANSFVDEMGRRPAELNTNKQKVSALLRAANTFNNIINAAADNADKGRALERAQKSPRVSGGNQGEVSVQESSTTRAGTIVAIHVCKSGDTPQSVSGRYFGNPDQAASILRANRLPLHTPSFPPGKVLVIPASSNASARIGA